MGDIKDTKRRIASVKNTQKITKAMKLVSAAKFAKANQAVLKAKPYGDAFDEMVNRLLSGEDELESPLLEKRPVKKVLMIVVASDRGLCGGLNSNIIKKVSAYLKNKISEGCDVQLMLWGKRIFMLQKQGSGVKEKKEKTLENVDFSFATEHAEFCEKGFVSGDYDQVIVAYPRFVNAITQKPEIEQLLPVTVKRDITEKQGDVHLFDYEPDKEILLEGLLKRKLAFRIYRILLEAAASEHSARMTAMDAASSNADEVIKKLTLDYNRARQAAITKELIEITSGAEAL